MDFNVLNWQVSQLVIKKKYAFCILGDNTEQMVGENRQVHNQVIDWKTTGKELLIKLLLSK